MLQLPIHFPNQKTLLYDLNLEVSQTAVNNQERKNVHIVFFNNAKTREILKCKEYPRKYK